MIECIDPMQLAQEFPDVVFWCRIPHRARNGSDSARNESESRKRSADEDPSQPRKGVQPAPTHTNISRQSPKADRTPDICGNCGRIGHRAEVCVKCSPSGWMETCPICNHRSIHFYDDCPFRNEADDYKYLIFNRQRKARVKSDIPLATLIAREIIRNGKSSVYLARRPTEGSDIPAPEPACLNGIKRDCQEELAKMDFSPVQPREHVG
ncbi:hypothetical protein F5Y17DRAFT_456027 [Xylariaceae sp. FL0594]|nr:hypothetical protein F5Y17DRAFT_456027 [Xylariaceae sp. FL0594]